MKTHETPVVLMADDDEDDCLLAKDAFEMSGGLGAFICVEDGQKLMDYLLRSDPLPALILLDLNMPRKDGREVLKEIKAIPAFQRIAIVILTTSSEEDDVTFSRKMGAKSFITKPAAFSEWIKMMKSLAENWLVEP